MNVNGVSDMVSY